MNPSGHLPETFPIVLADEPAHKIGTFGLEGTGEDRPAKELKGFAKVELRSGESREIDIDMPAAKALRYWSNGSNAYALAPAATVFVGESVEDIRLSGRVA